MGKRNILVLNNCYGCGVCSGICPKDIIRLKQNNDGFYQPTVINKKACVECGLCLKVCAQANVLHFPEHHEIRGFATWSLENAVRRKSSSGGTGFEVARYLVGKGYVFVGVKYNVEFGRAEHYLASTVEEIIPSMGSKYIQSFSEDAFRQIKKGQRYIITGTPCQIASVRRLVKIKRMEDEVVLMDFFCHGIPSKLVWDKYVSETEKRIGKLVYASWRNKRSGWHDSWAMGLDGEDFGEPVNWHDSYEMLMRGKKSYINSKKSDGDIFYKFFLGDMCFNKACYKQCKFKGFKSLADIRIGDFWGDKYKDNEDGVTGVLALTGKGYEVLTECNVRIIDETIHVVAEGQMKENSKYPYYYRLLLAILHSNLKLKSIYRFTQILRIVSIIRIKAKKYL